MFVERTICYAHLPFTGCRIEVYNRALRRPSTRHRLPSAERDVRAVHVLPLMHVVVLGMNANPVRHRVTITQRDKNITVTDFISASCGYWNSKLRGFLLSDSHRCVLELRFRSGGGQCASVRRACFVRSNEVASCLFKITQTVVAVGFEKRTFRVHCVTTVDTLDWKRSCSYM